MKTTDMYEHNIKGKNLFYARYSTVANLQVTDVRVNKIMSQEKDLKEKAGRLLCSAQVYIFFFLSGPLMCKFSFEYTYA